MNCEKAKELFPDALAQSLPEPAAARLREHLETCAACREEQRSLHGLWDDFSSLPDAEPSREMDRRFHDMLRSYRSGLEEVRPKRPAGMNLAGWLALLWPVRPAWQYAVLLLLFGAGLLAGWGLRPDRGAVDQGTELAQLRVEMRQLKEQMALALLDQQSASERLRGIEWTTRLRSPDERIFAALLRALDADPNVNVRLAAIEALQPFMHEAFVRKALRDALPRQESPLVQVELIQVMVEAEDRESGPILKSLIDTRQLDETVRERARWGLAQIG